MFKRFFVAGLAVFLFSFFPNLSYGATAFSPEVKAEDFLKQLQSELLSLQKKDFLMRWGGLANPFTRDLSVGSKYREDVLRLQGLLIMLSYLEPQFQTGGFFGITKRAVRSYQKNKGISATGYVGTVTRAALTNDFRLMAIESNLETAIGTSTLPERVTVVGDSVYRVFPKPDYDISVLGQKVFEGINEERVRSGLAKLQWSDDIVRVAKVHSDNQAVENLSTSHPSKPCSYPFIHHESLPGGEDVGDRLKQPSIYFRAAGENIAIIPLAKDLTYQLAMGEKAQQCLELSDFTKTEGMTREETVKFLTARLEERVRATQNMQEVQWITKDWFSLDEVAAQAVKGWMDSPGHKENILRDVFQETGIGIAIANDFVILTQVFLTR